MICIAENNGEGGINGGAGISGQPSQTASGAAASGYGLPVIECVTGTPCEFIIQLTKDYDGNVQADLSGIDKVMFYARPSMTSASRQISIECPFTTDGVITLELSEADLNNNNGVWYAEFHCLDKSGQDRQNYRAYLCIRKGMCGSRPGSPRTITAMDIRMAIMDTSPVANTLIDDLEFSDAQIYHAVQRCIDEFNEVPPTLLKLFDATNFPWIEYLLKGVVGVLLQEKAYQYLRNRMNYNAAGFTYDKADKGSTYIQLATAAQQAWQGFIVAKKTELNMSECFGVIDIAQFDTTRIW